MERWSKRGSHVGVVLSILIFIVFLIFLYTVLEPALKTDTEKDFLLGSLHGAITENTSEMVKSVPLNVISGSGGDICIKFAGIPNKIKPTSIDQLRIKDSNEEFHNYTDGGSGQLKIVVGTSFTGGSFTIYHIEEVSEYYWTQQDFQTVYGSCENLQNEGTDFTIGDLITSPEIISESNIFNLFTAYTNNPDGLKDELGIPDKYDFSFSLLDSEKNIIVEVGEVNPTAQNIYVEEFLVQYLDSSARILPGYLIIRIW